MVRCVPRSISANKLLFDRAFTLLLTQAVVYFVINKFCCVNTVLCSSNLSHFDINPPSPHHLVSLLFVVFGRQIPLAISLTLGPNKQRGDVETPCCCARTSSYVTYAGRQTGIIAGERGTTRSDRFETDR